MPRLWRLYGSLSRPRPRSPCSAAPAADRAAPAPCSTRPTGNPGHAVSVLSMGQWSLRDWIAELVRQAGPLTAPPDIVLCTWTAGAARRRRPPPSLCRRDPDPLVDRPESPHPAPRRLDRSRCPGRPRSDPRVQHPREVCRAQCPGRSHHWQIAHTGSANLNTNARMEHYRAADSPREHEMLKGMADVLFELQSPDHIDRPRRAQTRVGRQIRRAGSADL